MGLNKINSKMKSVTKGIALEDSVKFFKQQLQENSRTKEVKDNSPWA